MIAATAPAAVALRALSANAHVPRSIRAMRPATAAALLNGLQPSVVAGPAASAASSTATTAAVTLGLPSGGPNAAVPNCSAPATADGGFTSTVGLPNTSTLGRAAVTSL